MGSRIEKHPQQRWWYVISSIILVRIYPCSYPNSIASASLSVQSIASSKRIRNGSWHGPIPFSQHSIHLGVNSVERTDSSNSMHCFLFKKKKNLKPPSEHFSWKRTETWIGTVLPIQTPKGSLPNMAQILPITTILGLWHTQSDISSNQTARCPQKC